jgi:hypothetical protein
VQRDTVEFAAMVSGIAVAVAGGDAAQIGIGSAAGSNAAANNYLSHNKPPNSPRLSEREQLERARAECGPSNAAACDTATRLTQRSRDRDAVLVNACKDPGSSACRTEIRQAVAAGNTIDLRTGLPYSQGDGPPATIGPVTNAATNSWHNQQASSLAEGLINETFGAVAGAALRVIVAGSEIAVAGVRYGVNGTMEFLSSTGQVTGRMVNGEVLDALGGVIARQNPLNPGEFVAVARPGLPNLTATTYPRNITVPANTYSISPSGTVAANMPIPEGYTMVSRWVSAQEATLWQTTGGNSIPGAVPYNGTSQLYITEYGAARPAGATGTIRVDFAVPNGMIQNGNTSTNRVIIQPVQSTPIFGVQIHVPNGTQLPTPRK